MQKPRTGIGSRGGLGLPLLAAALVAALVAAAPSAPAQNSQGGGQLSDLTGSEHASAIEAIAERGILDGTLCEPDSFCPDAGITRAHLAMWLVRAVDGGDPDPVTETRFADVDPASPGAAYIERLAELGITKGCSPDPLSYCGDEVVTRAQMASFVVRAFGLSNTAAAAFSDVDRASVHARNIAVLAAAGYTAGCGLTTYCPNQPATRAYAASLVARAPMLAETEDAATEDSNAGQVCRLADDDSLTCTLGTSPYVPYAHAHAPAGLQAKAVSAGPQYACAITLSDNLTCWGDNDDGQASPPAGTHKAVSAGGNHACAITSNDTVTCWGDNTYNQATDPAGKYRAVTAGWDHTCAIATNGAIVCWGAGTLGQTTSPSGSFKSVAAGGSHTCAVAADDTIACWGENRHGETTAPTGTYKTASVGSAHSCAVATNGAIDCWGLNASGSYAPPTGTYKTVAAGWNHSCAIASRRHPRLLGLRQLLRAGHTAHRDLQGRRRRPGPLLRHRQQRHRHLLGRPAAQRRLRARWLVQGRRRRRPSLLRHRQRRHPRLLGRQRLRASHRTERHLQGRCLGRPSLLRHRQR